MKNIIIATLAVFALSGTAMAANSYGDQSKENTTIQGEKAPATTTEGAAPEQELKTRGDKAVENTNDPKHKLTPEEAAKNPVESITPSGDASPEE